MPLSKGKSKRAKHNNFIELMMAPVGKTRHKAIATIMRRRGVSYEEARKIQALAITK